MSGRFAGTWIEDVLLVERARPMLNFSRRPDTLLGLGGGETSLGFVVFFSFVKLVDAGAFGVGALGVLWNNERLGERVSLLGVTGSGRSSSGYDGGCMTSCRFVVVRRKVNSVI